MLLTALAAEPVTATVTVIAPPQSSPHCGVLHVVTLARVEPAAPTEGLPPGPLWVAISCPEMQPPLPKGATVCMTLPEENPGWPAPFNRPPEPVSWHHATEIRAGACD